MKCRLCGKEIFNYSEFGNVEIDVNTLFRLPNEAFPFNPMKIYWCEKCKLAQIENCLENDYYKHYNLLKIGSECVSFGGQAARHKEYLQNVMKELSRLVSQFDKKSLLDIGCGHGTVMEYAAEYFDEVEGVEASEEECAIAQKKGLHVVHSFFDERWDRKGYGAVISTQVWEHLENPYALMKKVYEILAIGGVVYIDVPVMRYAQGDYYCLFAEHINYWTVNSMAKLMDQCGFEILSIKEVLDGNHIACIGRKPFNQINFCERFEMDKEKFLGAVKIGIWGAGIKGRIFLKQLQREEKEKIIHLFDGDGSIEGLFVQNFDLPVEKPTQKALRECELIILTAVQYKREIIRELREDFGYIGEIRCLGEM